MNLLQETLDFLKEHGKAESDIRWIGSYDVRIPMDEWRSVFDVEYYNGFGGQEIADDLLVVGDNWWIERNEYDGKEWWVFKQYPAMPEQVIGGLSVTKSIRWQLTPETEDD